MSTPQSKVEVAAAALATAQRAYEAALAEEQTVAFCEPCGEGHCGV